MQALVRLLKALYLIYSYSKILLLSIFFRKVLPPLSPNIIPLKNKLQCMLLTFSAPERLKLKW